LAPDTAQPQVACLFGAISELSVAKSLVNTVVHPTTGESIASKAGPAADSSGLELISVCMLV
jgi:hypothetical protein